MFIDSGEDTVVTRGQGKRDYVEVGAAGGAELAQVRIIPPAFRTKHVLTPLAKFIYRGKYDVDTVWFEKNQSHGAYIVSRKNMRADLESVFAQFTIYQVTIADIERRVSAYLNAAARSAGDIFNSSSSLCGKS